MGMGIYAYGVKGSESGLGEMGNIESRAKMERAQKRARKVSEREIHAKNRSYRKNNRSYLYDDYDEYDEYEF